MGDRGLQDRPRRRSGVRGSPRFVPRAATHLLGSVGAALGRAGQGAAALVRAERPGRSGSPAPEDTRLNRKMLGRTLRGGAIGAVLFGGVSLLQAIRAGASFPRVLQPIGVFM